MRNLRSVSYLALFLSAVAGRMEAQAAPDSAMSALLWRDSASFFVSAPRGWVLDPEVAKRSGVLAGFYRRGESWATGQSVMYANSLSLTARNDSAFRAAIASAAQAWATRAGDAVITDLPNETAEDRSVATLKQFVSPRNGAFEVVAYIRNEAIAVLFVVSARSRAELDRALPDFLQIVRSYRKGPTVRQGLTFDDR